MKKLLLLPLLFFSIIFSTLSNSQEKIPSNLLLQLNVKEVIDQVDPRKIANAIYTPLAVRYVKNNDFAPSCMLIDQTYPENQLMLISPSENGQFGNCHTALKAPIIIKVMGEQFAIYRYTIEDPKSEFATSYQLVHLTQVGFQQCKNEELIHQSIEDGLSKKSSLLNASKRTLIKLGCSSQ